jgi:hypothetical protein
MPTIGIERQAVARMPEIKHQATARQVKLAAKRRPRQAPAE